MLAIEAMRSLERHGGSAMVERAFEGFVALAAPSPSKRFWWDVLEINRDASRDVIQANWKRLLRDRHPDQGGSTAMMAELNVARDEALAGIA